MELEHHPGVARGVHDTEGGGEQACTEAIGLYPHKHSFTQAARDASPTVFL